VGTRKIAIDWSALRLEMIGKNPVAIMDITRDQLRAQPRNTSLTNPSWCERSGSQRSSPR
jgi:hypothetical protein